MKLGAALYAGWVALVITGIVGSLGLAFQQPWLFPSLGPTIFIHTVTPKQEAARPWNTFVGHGIGAAAAFFRLPSLVLSMLPRPWWRATLQWRASPRAPSRSH